MERGLFEVEILGVVVEKLHLHRILVVKEGVLRSFSAVIAPVPNGMVKDEPELEKITNKILSGPSCGQIKLICISYVFAPNAPPLIVGS